MKATPNRTNHRVGFALHTSVGAVALLAMVALPLGCAEEDDQGKGEASNESGIDGIVEGSSALTGPYRDSEPGRGKHRKLGKRGKKGRMHRGPKSALVETALEQESLTPEQRERIEALIAESRPEPRGDRRQFRKDLGARMAKAVREGKVDSQIMADHLDTMTKQREERIKARNKLINALHTTLTPVQRQAIVDGLKARSEEGRPMLDGKGRRKEGFGKGKEGRSHGMLEGKGRHGKGRRPHGKGVGILRHVNDLDLTEAQQAEVASITEEARTNRPDKSRRKERLGEMKKCRDELLSSFAEDNFDAAQIRCQKRTDQERTARMEAHTTTLSKLVEILTPEQRNQLADRMENPRRRGFNKKSL